MESSDEDDDDEQEPNDDEENELSDKASSPTTNGSIKTMDEDGNGSYHEESKKSKASKESDETSRNGDADGPDATFKSSSSGITQDTTAFTATGSIQDTPSSLLQVGYFIMSFCAMIIVVTLTYLYRRVFRRARQPYVNIKQTSRATINSIGENDDEVDDEVAAAADDDDDESDHDDNEEGPRISRHAQSSQSVM